VHDLLNLRSVRPDAHERQPLALNLPADARDRLLRLATRSRKTYLGPDPARARAVQGAIGYDQTWRVFVNVKPEELQGSAGLGRRKTIGKDS